MSKAKVEQYATEQASLMSQQNEDVRQLTIQQEQSVQRQPSVQEIFIALAKDTSIDPTRIAQLMELQERAEKRDAERQFIAAMTRLQPRLPRIQKDGSIDLGRGKPLKFARYETLDSAIRPLLTEEGFSISFGTAPNDRGITITATLSHAGGHSRTESMPLPFDTGPGRNSLQAVGSTISYGKRYLVCAMLNLVTVNEDDDGNAMGFIDERQVNTLIDMQSACEMNAASQSKFLELMGTKTLGEIQRRDYSKAFTALQAKLKKKENR